MKTLAAAFLLLLPAAALAAAPIPAPPAHFVLDEPGVLGASAKRALETTLVEHARLTQEQIVVAIFGGLAGDDLVSRTNEVFEAWKIGQKGRDNGVLLALYWEDRKARIEVGYGLEATLTDSRAKRVIDGVLVPGLRAGQNDNAVFGATVEILRTLESPLMQSGQLEALLARSGQQGVLSPAPRASSTKSGTLVFILGLIAFIVIANLRSRRDAHFSRAGWYKTSPWGPGRSRGSKLALLGALGGMLGGGHRSSRRGGGGFGGLGGGGFSGGGGRSGGGGASGSW